MTVVQINCSSNGSTGNIAKAIHRHLMSNGERSYIFFGVGTPTQENMIRVGNDFSLHLHAVLSRNLGRQGYFSFLATKRLIKQLDEIKPDIIHLHNLHGSYLNLPLLFHYLKKINAEIVITLHDCWLFTGKCPYFTVSGCNKWKKSCGNCPQLKTYPRSKVDTTSKCLSDKKKWLSGFGDRVHIVAVSQWLCNVAKQSFLNQYSISTIYNGINTKIFRPMNESDVGKKYGIPDDKFVILGVASVWSDRKGLSEFLDLSEKICASDVIVLVGLSENQILNLPSNIIGIRRTENQEELAQLYSRADVFVNPSKEETFGLVTAEAIACGTPAAVFDSTACGEVVPDGCGILMDTREWMSVLDFIEAIRNSQYNVDPHRLHNAIEQRFAIERMEEEYINVYRKWTPKRES